MAGEIFHEYLPAFGSYVSGFSYGDCEALKYVLKEQTSKSYTSFTRVLRAQRGRFQRGATSGAAIKTIESPRIGRPSACMCTKLMRASGFRRSFSARTVFFGVVAVHAVARQRRLAGGEIDDVPRPGWVT